MGCKNSKPKNPRGAPDLGEAPVRVRVPALTKRKKEPRPDHSEMYPHLNYMTGEVTWKAYDAYDKLERHNAQRNIKHNVTWSPSRSEWT